MIISFVKIFLSSHKVFTRNDINPNFSQVHLLINYKVHLFAELKCYSLIQNYICLNFCYGLAFITCELLPD